MQHRLVKKIIRINSLITLFHSNNKIHLGLYENNQFLSFSQKLSLDLRSLESLTSVILFNTTGLISKAPPSRTRPMPQQSSPPIRHALRRIPRQTTGS